MTYLSLTTTLTYNPSQLPIPVNLYTYSIYVISKPFPLNELITYKIFKKHYNHSNEFVLWYVFLNIIFIQIVFYIVVTPIL